MAKRKNKKKHTKRSTSNKSVLAVLVMLLAIVVFYSSFDVFASVLHKSVTHYGSIKDVGLPKITDSTYYIKNEIGRFSLYYSPEDKQAHWVAYMLTKADLEGKGVKRSDNFRPDHRITQRGWSTATKPDYYKTSYDRGHLLPSADRNRSKIENSQTFIFSNITPQKANLNRNAWRILEQQIRDWANIYDTLYVVTGGVLNDKKLGYIGKDRVTVPRRFYKVILSVKNNHYNAIGFLMPNSSKVKDDYMQYCMTIDKIEKITKLNFFDNLPKKVERKVERKVNNRFWKQTQKGVPYWKSKQ